VLHLPGHSPDSIALFDETDGVFFSGDAIYDDGLIDDLPDSDRDDYRRTMQRLLNLPIRVGHGGHGPSFSRARMVEIAADYLRRSNGFRTENGGSLLHRPHNHQHRHRNDNHQQR
jgi:glyoxylase-like metal-dependent hydrolase (beta-lactamase superfamily II)